MWAVKNIAFFGHSDLSKKDKVYQDAFRVAQILASKGFTIVNGGGPGVMMAATEGAKSVGGETLSITFYPHGAPGFEGRYLKNVTDREIETGNYIERMFKLFEHGDLYIIFKGGTGTFSEFATAWCLSRLYFGLHKPFILYGEFWKEIIAVFKKNMYLRGEEEKVFKIVNSPEAVLRAIEQLKKEYADLLGKIIPKEEGAFILGYRGPVFDDLKNHKPIKKEKK
jgi:hypothetical protein